MIERMTVSEWRGYKVLSDGKTLPARFIISKDASGAWQQLASLGQPEAEPFDPGHPGVAAFLAECPPVNQEMIAQ